MTQQKTLFSLLLGLPWWISALVGAVFFGVTQLFFGNLSPFVAPSVALPFVVLTAVVAYRQLRSVSPGRVEQRLKALRDMSWEDFSPVISAAYRRQGYEVSPSSLPGFDFTLRKNGRLTLVQCRRWKVNQAGAGPLQELAAAVVKQDAYNGVAICAGEFSANARDFAKGKPVSLLTGAELAAFVGAVGKSNNKWFSK